MKYIKSSRVWESEDSQQSGEKTERHLNRLLGLGLISQQEFEKGIKEIDLQGWADEFYSQLEALCNSEPDKYLGVKKTRYASFEAAELTVAPGLLDLPETHYNDWSYQVVDDEPALIVIGLGVESTVEIRALYANHEDAAYDDDDDGYFDYDGTWIYNGEINIFTVDDLVQVLKSFDSEVALGDEEGDWYRD
jgi:hypothetical protein